VSDWAQVLTGIFTSDLYKPLIPYQESAQDGSELPASRAGLTLAPTNPKVMQIKEDPDIGLDPLPDWRILYLNCLVRIILPFDRTEARYLVCCAKSFVLLDR
jgi:hypothetical protein